MSKHKIKRIRFNGTIIAHMGRRSGGLVVANNTQVANNRIKRKRRFGIFTKYDE